MCVEENFIFLLMLLFFSVFFFFCMIHASNGSSKVALLSKRLERSLGLLHLVFMKGMVLFKKSSL